jgi:hypothetical protein
MLSSKRDCFLALRTKKWGGDGLDEGLFLDYGRTMDFAIN